MKRLFISLLVLSTLFAFRVYILKPHKVYLKEETVLKYLKKQPFLTKKTPQWMFKQIDEDFSDIKEIRKEDIDRTLSKLSLSFFMVHYRILDNQLFRFFPDKSPITIEDNHIEKALKTLMKKVRLPNMDFIISFQDAYPFSFPAPEELGAPIFVFAKMKGAKKGILIPDERSVGTWWFSEIREIRKNRISWEKKKGTALWRGGYTKEVRKKLCELSLQYPKFLDARFCRSGPREKAFDKDGLTGERCCWTDYLKYKYLPCIDGVMCATPALQGRLFSQSVTFKPDSDEVQWFYRSLKPNVHYIPVKSDLSDLIEQLKWARSHDETCQKISNQAYEFAKENLMAGDVFHYLHLLFQRYAFHQNLNQEEFRKDTLGDPQWVKIQYRNLSPFLQRYDGFSLPNCLAQ